MTRFSSSTQTSSVVRAERAAIWEALTDPVLLPKLTPFLHSIEVDTDERGHLWHWQLTRIPVLGVSVVPAFTERMMFDEPHRIDFVHDPPPGRSERAGVEGQYLLAEAEAGTKLSISLSVAVDLPLSRLAAPAVGMAMKGVISTMGVRFSSNLLHHLGID
ncbi:SRPBCC family protein [Nocardioides sp.]|uniref:SRPBCC family protein n=1 Tax=Nocardioides sp. TaxID=35761 RepID=UPI003D13C2A6